ncbi:MAG: hypothetical protein WDA16_06865, partial [Candidatus Thermoplasmatota archaeon]
MGAEAPPTVPVHTGVSGEDLGTILLTLARGHPDVLALLSPVITGDGKVSVPMETLEAARDPPPIEVTLATLATTFRLAPPAPLPALPPELERALSSIGQGILAAEALRAAGEPYGASMALRDAYSLSLPVLERDTILLAWPEAYIGLAMDEAGTQPRLDALSRARTRDDALSVAGIVNASPLEPRPLPEALAILYARLGLPIDAQTRAGLAASSEFDPTLKAPLELALAHIERARQLREEAFEQLSSGQLDLLAATPDLQAALTASSPTPQQLTLLASYGLAIDTLDRERMLEAAAHLVAASDALAMTATYQPVQPPCCTATADPDEEGRVRIGIGGVVVEFAANGHGDARVWVGEGDAEPETYPNARVAVDPRRLALVVYEDGNGNLVADPGESLFSTPPLANPENDVLFQDPYGLVVVSGNGNTRTDAHFGGRTIDVTWGKTVEVPSVPENDDPLSQIDDLLVNADPYGVWPTLSEPVRRAMAEPIETPTHARATVNPAGYQILRWDLGGNDEYLTNAGGAGTRGLLSIEADGLGTILRENATAAPLPVTLLVDLAGDDTYRTRENDTLASANASVALLVDWSGRDSFRSEGARGLVASGVGGVALLFSGPGNSTYEARDGSAVRATAGATALLFDAGGADSYRGGNESLAASDLGALAALIDAGGNDTYRSLGFSQAASRGGIAALIDAEGNDTYETGARADAQGYAEQYPASGLPCPLTEACLQALGPARVALFLDAQGRDTGACPLGQAENGLLGVVGIGRAPSDPFNPAAGFCIEIDASPLLPTNGGAIELPPTFFTSSLATFSIPGLARFGSIGNDTVLDPFLLNVDIGGNDTYAVGAAASVDLAGAASREFEWLAPISIHVDTDGNDTHDARLARHNLGGAFGYANGGIALHATTSTLRFAWDPSAPMSLGSPYHTQRYRNVSVGMGAAERGGIALFIRDGISIDVEGVPGATTCRLACARTGGVAIALGRGPGDNIIATPWSLGAVQETELGGLAVYYQRGGRDTYGGSNQSMGYTARVLSEQTWTNAHESVVERRPNVALFIDDGYERDVYSTPLNWTRGNNRFWEDQPTLASFHAFGNRSLHVAQGIDNLDWYANANLAAADEGIAEETGPGTNSSVETPVAAPEERPYDIAAIIGGAIPPKTPTGGPSAVYNNYWTAVRTLSPVWMTTNATLGQGGEPLVLNVGHERGDGGS